jgi:hypothetical protein
MDLAEVRNFEQNYPHLVSEFKKGHVWCWDAKGYTRELTKQQNEELKALEDSSKEYGLKVYAVIDSVYDLGETVHMASYLYAVKDETGFSDIDYGLISYDDPKGMYYAIACVHNYTWDIVEHGSIIIARSPGGGPIRVG